MFIKSLYKYAFALLILISFSLQSNAQGGISFTAGLAGAKNQLKETGSKIGTGYTGAAEARFLGQDMYFIIQLQYAKYQLLPTSDFSFATKDNNFQVGHGRIGMGFTLFRLGYNSIVRAKILGSIDKTIQYTSSTLSSTDFRKDDTGVSDKMNDATVGALVGLGFDFKWFVVDVEYERGFINAFYKVPGSNFDYFSVRTGILIN